MTEHWKAKAKKHWRLIIVWLWLAMMAGSCLYPPWIYRRDQGEWRRCGWHFVWTKVIVRNYRGKEINKPARPNKDILWLEWITLTLIAGGALATPWLAKKASKERTPEGEE